MSVPDPVHLGKNAAAALGLSDVERIRFIQQGSWIDIGKSKAIVGELQELLAAPRVGRPPCRLIVGDSNSGKTRIFERLMELNPPGLDPLSDTSYMPLISIQAPEGPQVDVLYSRILQRLLAKYKTNSKPEEKRSLIVGLFEDLGVRMLLIDEVHNILAGTSRKQEEFRNALKGLTNETRINIVAAGVQSARTAFVIDEQFTSRFRPLELSNWSLGKDLGTLLATLESRIPLSNPSNLSHDSILIVVDRKANGNFGDIVDLIRSAAIYVIKNKLEPECITLELLQGLKWAAPSDLKTYARSGSV